MRAKTSPSPPKDRGFACGRRAHGVGLSACALAALLAFDARAQWSEFGGIAGGLSNAGAQAAPASSGGRGFSITPYVTLSETLTDNANLTSDGEWDAITQATVGLSMFGTYGSLSGGFSIGLTGSYYARGTGENRIDNTNTLNAAGTLALVEDRVFLDGYAVASQQLIDPFGVRPSDPARTTDNTTTTLDYGLSPWARGTIGGSVDYFARLNFTGSTNAESSAYGFQDFSGLARLEGATRFRRLGWALTAAGRASAYGDAEVRTGNYGGTASLIYTVTPYFNVRANAGVEFQNYLDADVTQRSQLYGAGFEWQPTDRTSITGFYENRFFGDSYIASVQHRTAKTVWTYSGRQGISEVGGVTPVSLGTNYDLFFQQFASIEPDPVKRDQLVRQFLQRTGIPLEQQVVAGFLTTQIQLERSHDFSFAWLIGRRNSLTLSVGQTDSSALVDFLGAGDVFDTDSYVREQSFSATFSHQLTPRSSISVYGGRTNADDRDGTRSTTQDTLFVNWGTTLGSRSRFDVTARRTDFESPTAPYTENALIATFYMSF
jgi:uncharacterized protein (PEP-CTERM system associated)